MGKARISLADEHHIAGIDRLADQFRAVINLSDAMAGTTNPHEITEALIKITHAFQIIEEHLEILEAIVTKLRSETLPSIYGDKTSNITMLGYRATVSHSLRASIRAPAKEEALKWIENNGHGSIIDRAPRVNPSTLSAWAKTLTMEGEDLPEELFSLFYFDNTSLTKVASKKK